MNRLGFCLRKCANKYTRRRIIYLSPSNKGKLQQVVIKLTGGLTPSYGRRHTHHEPVISQHKDKTFSDTFGLAQIVKITLHLIQLDLMNMFAILYVAFTDINPSRMRWHLRVHRSMYERGLPSTHVRCLFWKLVCNYQKLVSLQLFHQLNCSMVLLTWMYVHLVCFQNFYQLCIVLYTTV